MRHHEQMDASEFFAQFFDKLESALKGTPHAELLNSVFGGKLSNQVRNARFCF
jgi:hypothetical protein